MTSTTTATGGNLYDDLDALLDGPEYRRAACGSIVHVDDSHDDEDDCELCEDLRRRR
jgi:hypothetical protein